MCFMIGTCFNIHRMSLEISCNSGIGVSCSTRIHTYYVYRSICNFDIDMLIRLLYCQHDMLTYNKVVSINTLLFILCCPPDNNVYIHKTHVSMCCWGFHCCWNRVAVWCQWDQWMKRYVTPKVTMLGNLLLKGRLNWPRSKMTAQTSFHSGTNLQCSLLIWFSLMGGCPKLQVGESFD